MVNKAIRTATSAKRLLATQAALVGVHEVAEKLPTGGRLEKWHLQLGGHAVQGTRGWHGSSHTLSIGVVVCLWWYASVDPPR